MGFALSGVESGSFVSILHYVLCNCRIRSFVSTLHYELCNCALCVAFMLLLVLKIYVLHLSVTINSDVSCGDASTSAAHACRQVQRLMAPQIVAELLPKV